MGEIIEIEVNDAMREIQRIANNLRQWESDLCDRRIKAIILTKLEEAELFAQRLVLKTAPAEKAEASVN